MSEINCYNYHNTFEGLVKNPVVDRFQHIGSNTPAQTAEVIDENVDNIKTTNNKIEEKIINDDMKTLLEQENIVLDDDTQFLISFDPYSYGVTVEGSSDIALLSKMSQLLNSSSLSKSLFNYSMQNTVEFNNDSVAKFKAFQAVKNYTSYDLSKLTLRGGEYYTPEGKNLSELIKNAIQNDSNISTDSKNEIYEDIMTQVNTVAEKGWNGISDLELNIGYSPKDGFYPLGGSWEA